MNCLFSLHLTSTHLFFFVFFLQVEWAVELGKQLMYTTLEEIESGAGEYDYSVLGWCLAQMVWYGRCVVRHACPFKSCAVSSCLLPDLLRVKSMTFLRASGVLVSAVAHAGPTGLPSCAWSRSGSSGL